MLNEAADYAVMMSYLTGRNTGKITMHQLGCMDTTDFALKARQEMDCPGGMFGTKSLKRDKKDVKLTFTLPPFSSMAEMTYVVAK